VILLVILNTSIVSPCSRLYFKGGRFKCIRLSLYGNFFKFITILVALFWIFSISLISPCLYGHHAGFAYSKCGRTIDLYNNRIVSVLWMHVVPDKMCRRPRREFTNTMATAAQRDSSYMLAYCVFNASSTAASL